MTYPDNDVPFLLVVELVIVTLVARFDSELTLDVGVSCEEPMPDCSIEFCEFVDNCDLQKAYTGEGECHLQCVKCEEHLTSLSESGARTFDRKLLLGHLFGLLKMNITV